MSLYELVDIAQATGVRIDVQWGFFLTIHMALLGGIVYVDRPLSQIEKSLAFFLYTVFAVMNYRVLRMQQRLLEQVYNDIAALQFDTCCIDSVLLSFFVSEVEAGFTVRIHAIAVFLHVLAFAIVALSIVADRARTPHSHDQPPSENTSLY